MSDTNDEKLSQALEGLMNVVSALSEKIDNQRNPLAASTWTQAITNRLLDALDKHGVAVVLVFVLLGLLIAAGWKIYEGILEPHSASAIQAMDRVAKATEIHAAAMAHIDNKQTELSVDVENIRHELGKQTVIMMDQYKMLKTIHEQQK